MPCIITGCWLVDPQQERRVWGDLYTLGDCYIFVAVTDSAGSVAWTYSEIAPNEVGRELVLVENMPNSSYFTLDRIFIVHEGCATLNEVARKYARGGLV